VEVTNPTILSCSPLLLIDFYYDPLTSVIVLFLAWVFHNHFIIPFLSASRRRSVLLVTWGSTWVRESPPIRLTISLPPYTKVVIILQHIMSHGFQNERPVHYTVPSSDIRGSVLV